MIRPLTPDEAEALSRPAVQACIRSINDDLVHGFRRRGVPKPLAEAVATLCRAHGWTVEIIERAELGVGYVSLEFSAPHNDDDLAAIGRTILGAVP